MDAKLVELVVRLQTAYDGATTLTFNETNRRTVILAHGWYVVCLRTATAIIKLDAMGLGFEAAPLRRSLIEHSLGLVWLSYAGDDAVDSLLKGYQEKNVKKMLETLHDDQTSPDVLEALREIAQVTLEGSSEDHYLSFKHLCERFNVNRIYAAWLYNTAHSHATWASAISYVRYDGDDPHLVREPVNPVGSAKEIVALLLLASMWLTQLLDGDRWTKLLHEIEGEFLLLTGADAMPPAGPQP